jgi:uncharacterized protein (DUF1810 family)
MAVERFVEAQEDVYPRALAEIEAGSKRSHWMWFVFPQIAGLGSSHTAQRYAITDLAEAREYLAHPVLGPRLRECAAALLRHHRQVFAYPDDLKLRSSMTLFARAADDSVLFEQVLDRFYDGPDQRTIALLGDKQDKS